MRVAWCFWGCSQHTTGNVSGPSTSIQPECLQDGAPLLGAQIVMYALRPAQGEPHCHFRILAACSLRTWVALVAHSTKWAVWEEFFVSNCASGRHQNPCAAHVRR